MNVGPSAMYPFATSFELLADMKAEFEKLQQQLATGQKATSLAEMGNTRLTNLSLRGRIDDLEAYSATMATVNLRLSVMSQAVSTLQDLKSAAATSATIGGYGSDDINLATAPSQARANLDQVVTLLNSEAGGRYLFAGNKTEKPPVPPIDTLLDGDGARAGFNQVAAERLQADQGPPDASGAFMGRLAAPTIAGSVVTLSEDGAHPFGLKLGTLSTTAAGLTLTPAGGTPPQSVSIDFTAQPKADDTLTLGLTLPDGSSTSVTLKAVTGTAGPGQFAIGATPDETAQNFAAALTGAIHTVAAEELPAASRYAAAGDFFNGQGQPARRVDGPPFDTATALKTASAADTVLWYQGQDSGSPEAARMGITARVSDSTSVAYGVEGNEKGMAELVRALAVMATSSFTPSDPTAHARFDATVARQTDRLSSAHDSEPGSIATAAVALGLAQGTAKDAADRQATYKSQLEDVLGSVENVDGNTVAMQIMALQTRLQASYQATALVSRLTLVNYMGNP